MPPTVPPHALLEHVIAAIAADVPNRFDVLLAADRFADARNLLARLKDPTAVSAATRVSRPAEAARLAALLLARWAELGPAELPPFAVLLAPDESTSSHRIAVHGVDHDWTAVWSGPVHPAEDTRSATADEDASPGSVTARVFARTSSGRTVLAAHPVLEPGP